MVGRSWCHLVGGDCGVSAPVSAGQVVRLAVRAGQGRGCLTGHLAAGKMPGMTIERFKVVAMFLVAWLAAQIFWGFVARGFMAHHADNAAVQGLAGVIN